MAASVTVPEPHTSLSHLERERLIAYGQGKTYAQIAKEAGVAWDTVKNQLWAARKKMATSTTLRAFHKLMRQEASR